MIAEEKNAEEKNVKDTPKKSQIAEWNNAKNQLYCENQVRKECESSQYFNIKIFMKLDFLT